MQTKICAELGRRITATANADLNYYLHKIAKAEQPYQRRMAVAMVRNTPAVYAAYLAEGGSATDGDARDLFASEVIDAALALIVQGAS